MYRRQGSDVGNPCSRAARPFSHAERGAVDLMLHFRSQLVTGIVPFYLEHRVMLNI